MKVTQESDYALRILLFLSKLGKGVKVDAKTISETEGVTLRFTLKILRKLTMAKLVVSFRGVNGGYALNHNPAEISMKDVIEAIEGEIYLNKCLYDENLCNLSRSSTCKLHKAFEDIQKVVIKEFENKNLAQILES